MAHELILSTQATGRYFARRGALHASTAAARRALRQHRRDVFVMPGGDRDAWRPYRRRHQVEFAGRTGYARVALELGVPIVPVSNVGPHETFRVLTDGRQLARAVGLHRLVRAEIWPVHLSLPWGLAIGPWPHLPWPTRFSYRLGAPIAPEACSGAPTPEQVRRLDERVRQAVQAGLDELARTRG
jgi:1-acyl-sn-glycerol-3-phosphate acyltransferase